MNQRLEQMMDAADNDARLSDMHLFFQDCGCYQHERDQQPLPRCLQHHLHAKETRHGVGQHVRKGSDNKKERNDVFLPLRQTNQ